MEKPFSAYRGDEPYVFVCYAHEDAAVVYPELQRLRDQGINIWYDDGIPAGTNWRAQIGGALDGAAQLLFYVSGASVGSEHCSREINYALDEDKQIVPVLLEEVPLPADLKIGLSRVQMIHKTELSDDAYGHALEQALAASRGARQSTGVQEHVAAGSTRPHGEPQRAGPNRWIAMAIVAAVVGAFGVYELQRNRAAPEVSPQTSQEVAETPASRRSIAVLPFVNMSSDPEQEYFSDGLSEELLNLLAKNPELKVISRSSAFTFKGKEVDIPTVAQRLGVAHVLEGSVRTAGRRIRVTAQLIDAETDTHLWSDTYDRELDDVFAIQDEIAANVVEQLNATLFGVPTRDREVNLGAYTLYLHARELASTGTPENLRAAEGMLQQALAIDPEYAEAWIEIARTYARLRNSSAMAGEEAQRLSKEALERARAIDPENAEIYAGLAGMAMFVQRDLRSAARYLERALALEPTNLRALDAASALALNLGRLEDAHGLMEYVTTHDPLCANCFSSLGAILLLQGDLDHARRAFETFELLGGPADANLPLALTLLLQGEYEASMAVWARANPGPFRTYGETITLYSMGRTEEFAVRFQELKDRFGDDYPTMVARVYAWMGDEDAAFEWLDRFHVEHPELGPIIGNFWELLSVELHGLHDDPRWHAHLQKLGLAPEQLAVFQFDIPLPENAARGI